MSLSDQDPNVFRAGNDDMKQKTMAYAERARRIAENEMLKEETSHPWKEVPHSVSCTYQIYEFEGDHVDLENGPPTFSNPRDEFMYWESTAKDGLAEKRNRRIIILEDVSARLAEMLGILLDIPPEFFLAHCDESVDLNIMDEHLISYWGKSYGNGSWTAVFLLDPQLSHLHLNGLESVVLENWDAGRDVLREVIVNSSRNNHTQMHKRSMFNTLVKAYENVPMVFNDDVFSATYFARNCIRAVWEEHVWRRKRHFHNVLVEDERLYRVRQKWAYESDEAIKAYDGLMQERQSINFDRMEIQAITWKFQLRDTGYLPLEDERTRRIATREDIAWRLLEEKLQAMDGIISSHMEMYTVRANMEEAHEAKIQSRESYLQTEATNKMARSSGQLAKIATVVVPCTFVASVLSMNGDFAAGERLFYVYWTISVPVTLILLFWVIDNEMSRGVSDCKEWVKSIWSWSQGWRRPSQTIDVTAEKPEV
ncbi:uncharacterized protein Triagg1_6729 [Trichoderma aggressivum f. europaeum]|uniref:Uncharacterized protein n=1 Tax=Trichoderma aggressivum f. europaeum TaxID=173218 RepID=A0AAE1IDA0_9HYPO|nr:hypothetical protein Triagg1_6729 [Trichoderma aggressivum f. europaeum]